MQFASGDLLYIAPFLVLAMSGILLVLAEAFYSGRDRTALAALTVAGALAATVTSVALYRHMGATQTRLLFNEMLIADRTGYVLTALFGVVAALAALLAPAHQRTHGWVIGEYYGILLLAVSGMVLLAQAANPATVFLGVETMSIGHCASSSMRAR